jgi:FAD:protein FMN transferase
MVLEKLFQFNQSARMPEVRNNPSNPSRRQCLRLAMGMGGVATAFSTHTKTSTLNWHERAMVALGTTLTLRAGHAIDKHAEAGLDAAVNAIRHVERHMSLFNPESSLCRLNRDGVLTDPDPDLVKILMLASNVSQRSLGSFDITVQPIWKAWERAKSLNRLPTKIELELARGKTGWRNIEISDAQIRLLKPGMALTLNGIAQGYASDLARDALRVHGIEHALIDTGEWSTLGQSDDSRPWLLGVENPRFTDAIIAKIVSDGRAVATSSDAHCSFSSDLKHHHIFDPKTAYSPNNTASVTVLAPTCTLADALTKVMFMAGPHQAVALAKKWQVDVIIVDKAGRIQTSPALRSSLLT